MKEEVDFISGMNMCDEISNEAYKKIMCHCEEQKPCEDAISRADAVRVESGYCHPANIAKELAKLPPVTPTQRWIPVSERLPEENGFYLATCDGEICGENEPFTGLAEYENGKWVDDEEDYQCVLAWMPLPKPYKESEEE